MRWFLKVASEVAEWKHSRRLFQREGAQEQHALAPALVLTQRTNRIIPLFDLHERDGSDGAKYGAKINRLFVTKSFVRQQTDLELNFKFYW